MVVARQLTYQAEGHHVLVDDQVGRYQAPRHRVLVSYASDERFPAQYLLWWDS